ncbi:Zinc finger C2H2 [Penicillium expansum]|nr:Zinc finger C2H2 [Penicillium expansum]
MASPSCNAHCDHSQVPDGYDWAVTNFNYTQFVPLAYQSSTSILAEPSIASVDPLPYTYPIQYPAASVASSFAVPSASPSAGCDLYRFNQNAIHQSPIENDRAAMAPGGPATGSLGPRHDVACTNLPGPASSIPEAPRVKASGDSYAKGKGAYVRNQGRQQKQE